MEEKFCKYCGEKIPADAIICTKCGRQVEELGKRNADQSIVINNTANATVDARGFGRKCDKMISLLLCLFLGWCGGHKFYEGKIGMGIVYLFTGGLFFIGAIVDFLNILGKTNPYYVN